MLTAATVIFLILLSAFSGLTFSIAVDRAEAKERGFAVWISLSAIAFVFIIVLAIVLAAT